jgi:hypothetical protein
MLPGECQEYLKDLDDAIKWLTRRAEFLEAAVVRLVKDFRV